MRSIVALVILKVTKRDKEEHGTGDDYRLEEYISQIESVIKNDHHNEG